MEKIVWIIEQNRDKVLELQHRIRAIDGMQANCVLTKEALQKRATADNKMLPAVILLDEKMIDCITLIKEFHPTFNTPIFVMTEEISDQFVDECYEKGITGVISWPLTERDMTRIHAAAHQYETGRQYEKILQRQTRDLEMAQEIYRLNQQLKSRNDFLHQIFGKYFSDDVLEMILAHPQGAAIGGEKKEVTVLISDLRGFTALAEKMSPEKMTELLNCYFGKMAEIITGFHGTIIEFMGDGILAVFGAPLFTENHWENGVAAAVCMQNSMDEVNRFGADIGVDKLSMGIGLHCGETFIGNVGSEKMMRYNVLGQVVNICSRIESLSVGGQILLSNALRMRIEDKGEWKPLTKVMVKGIKEEIEIFELEGYGQYRLVKEAEKPTYLPKDDIEIQVQEISRKMVERERSFGKLLSFSEDEIIVSGICTECFTDVRFSGTLEQKLIFAECYGKVVACQQDEIRIHFTRISHELEEYIKENSADS